MPLVLPAGTLVCLFFTSPKPLDMVSSSILATLYLFRYHISQFANSTKLTFTPTLIGNKQTSATSEVQVKHAEDGMPWDHDDQTKTFKYKYHPGGDTSKAPKEAPSALHSVIVENVTLPKVRYHTYMFCPSGLS